MGEYVVTNMTFTGIYTAVTTLFALANISLGVLSLRHRGRAGASLGMTAFYCAWVELSYLISALSSGYFAFSLSSSIYFIGVDLMLISLLEFSAAFSQYVNTKLFRHLRRLVNLYGVIDIVAFLVNPFREISISYASTGAILPSFEYVMFLMYKMHLVYTYAIVLCSVLMLVNRLRRVPREYRKQYVLGLVSIAIIVLINAFFLYIPLPSLISRLDLSVLGYTVGLYFLYYSSMNYSVKGMMDNFRVSIFESIMQGILLFDYNDCLIMHNSRAQELLPEANLQKGLTYSEFLPIFELEDQLKADAEPVSVMCYTHREGMVAPVRCDHRILNNDYHQKIGRLLVFTDETVTRDILTGFHMWDNFKMIAPSHDRTYAAHSSVAILDICGLTMINKTQGRNQGDRAIRELARLMQEYFPKQTYFVRGQDANLIALTNTTSEDVMQEAVAKIKDHCNHNIIYSISGVNSRNPNVLAAIADAMVGLQVKKLMDKDSIHSQLLTSLMRALEECDEDTEAHVRRTQKLGEMLGTRIGLSDVEQSQLSLLCMLHDIGKIGIPLEILNKPGRLSPAEWKTIQSHVEKGYQIALSVEELSGIADSIRHHHERWDGNGYPDHLAENEIPMLSRIISVVDAYDAMTNDRSYRKALTQEAAILELKRCRGSQFDPKLVDEFLNIIPLVESHDTVERPATVTDIIAEILVAESSSQIETVHPVVYTRYVLDENLAIVTADESFNMLTGYSLDDVRGENLHQFDLIPPEDRAEYFAEVSKCLAKGPFVYLEHRILCKDGRMLYVFCYGKQYFDSVARANYTEIVVFDVSQTYSMRTVTSIHMPVKMRQTREVLNIEAEAWVFDETIFRQLVEKKISNGTGKVLLMQMEVDGFRQYFQQSSKEDGEKYLRSVMQAISGALRSGDPILYKESGEYVAAVTFDPECDDRLVRQRAQQIFEKTSMTLAITHRSGYLSMGAAITGDTLRSYDSLCQSAAAALKDAEKVGRSSLSFGVGM